MGDERDVHPRDQFTSSMFYTMWVFIFPLGNYLKKLIIIIPALLSASEP